MATKIAEQVSPRERLIAAADELFYEEGVHTVGIDRIIERAGVAKATLYSAFGSKDGLIRAYLEARHLRRRERISVALERYDNPRDRLLGMFDVLGEFVVETNFRGCVFYNASAESPAGGVAEQVSDEARSWSRALFVELARDAGAKDPEQLAGQLQLLYDGALMGARMDRCSSTAEAKAVAAALLDIATR